MNLSGIRYISIYLGDTCNFDCSYCDRGYIKGLGGQTLKHSDLPDIFKFFDWLKEQETPDLTFLVLHGGEPFLFISRMKELLGYLGPWVREKGIRISITTNGSLILENKDFVEEWVSICDNRFLLSKKRVFFPFSDETAANIVLWKRNIRRNLGRVYLNTTLYEPFEFIEENDNIKGDPNINNGIMGSDLLRCDNSSQIMLYHGMKDKDVLNKVGIYQNKKENI